MIGKTISHYKILQKLGEGGMGVIYKAEDTTLKRIVALKFLPPEHTSDEHAKTRFVREAQAASVLQHNNICTVHEIDETPDGRMFICMDFYEGQTLKEKITGGPLPVEEALGILIQLAEGLAKAHSVGIVHRDIKPANLLVTSDGVIKILDFGMAKLAGVARVTKTGTRVGTALYMSPEQIRGEDVDGRADIWSVGVVLYEMVTGRFPFKREYEHVTVYSILYEEPAPMTRLKSELPVDLERIRLKAMAKRPKDRYGSATDLLADLKSLRDELVSGIPRARPATEEPQPSIAVLPFANMSTDKEQDYFCDGIAEDIINGLAHIGGLRVAARTSAFAFKGKNEDIREIGRRLGVDTVLEGSVRKAGDRLRVTAQLLNVADGYHLWSERYESELKDVFAIQDEISDNVIRALQIELTRKEEQVLKKVKTQNVVAYDLYLRGREFFHKRHPKAIHFAIEMFSRAIEKDANYALAYAGIADCYCFLSHFDDNEAYAERAMTATEKALELDPELAEAHVSRGLALSTFSTQYDEAEREFEAAIGLNPELFEAYYFYAYSCRTRGRIERAAGLLEKACLVRPEDFQAQNHLAMAYTSLNLRAQAETAYRRCVENAERHLEFNPDDARAYQLGGISLIQLGEREKGIAWATRAAKMDPENPVHLYNTACILSVVGKTEEALDCFNKAIESGYRNKGFILNDPDLDPIRDHPRFHSIMEKLN